MVYRVLIVTADTEVRDSLCITLADATADSFCAEWVASWSAALPRLQAGDIDVVVLDSVLPGSKDSDAFVQVFASVPHVPIITLWAAHDQVRAEHSLALGAKGYLLKGLFAGYLMMQLVEQVIGRKRADAHQSLERTRAQITLHSISDAVIGTDMQGVVDYLNPAAERMTGWPHDEARGQPITRVMNLVNRNTDAAVPNPVRLVLREQQPMGMAAGTVLVRRDGSQVAIDDSAAPIVDLEGHVSGAVIVFHDVSEARSMTLKMAHLAQHDVLTQLPNRVLLNDRIAQAIGLAERSGNAIALMFIDLDHFKCINDAHGHAIGDQLLQAVAQRLLSCVRNSDTVSRNGGDEFVVLLAEGRNMQDASITAQKIITALAEPFVIDRHELRVTCSIGISVCPVDADNAEALLKHADTAMYHAKQAGRNNYQFFKQAMNLRALERKDIESALTEALVRQDFMLHYQPKFNLQTGVVTGAEALLRWVHPQWGITLPERFVAVAEECGLLVQIGRWVLREACRQTRQWQEQGLALASIAVNISALEFLHPDFVANVQTTLQATGLQAACLQLEISECVLMHDAVISTGILQRLKDLGVQLAVDDFGTGYSSLNYLLAFPIDVLKIDKSVVHAISTSSGLVAQAMILVGSSLQYKVVAEGVENQAQLSFLKNRQCAEGQGYLFSHGLRNDQFARLFLGKPGVTGDCAGASPSGDGC
ncbi:MAG: EAL domain-containing protein [Gammaproteobacteria bacterium]|nr:EAL domain-containing protein [Gammaproteobacteria bacterium]MBU2080302.1 EAL domain-containing protein [Alphaproteobacteria bacterium]MBU1489426.1 EAL domain-containing protein [Gammaproteobacteria bacterium]MBU2156702.1 EAL domain-containing protein [Gammaproteobacteria bacterium]MBU2253214.1 EAL domain-containing protein [Gammaproteobacteria bacterium]